MLVDMNYIDIYDLHKRSSSEISISITKASKVSTQIFDLVRWFGPTVLLTGGH